MVNIFMILSNHAVASAVLLIPDNGSFKFSVPVCVPERLAMALKRLDWRHKQSFVLPRTGTDRFWFLEAPRELVLCPEPETLYVLFTLAMHQSARYFKYPPDSYIFQRSLNRGLPVSKHPSSSRSLMIWLQVSRSPKLYASIENSFTGQKELGGLLRTLDAS